MISFESEKYYGNIGHSIYIIGILDNGFVLSIN